MKLSVQAFLRLIICAAVASGELKAEVDYLRGDWEAQSITPKLLVGPQNESVFFDVSSIQLKGDIAYSDEDTLTLARASLRFLSEGSPKSDVYLKADVQINYFNIKDDLLLGRAGAEYAFRVNDLWAQSSGKACNVKLGRQAIIWGGVEGTGSLDLVSPMDLSEPLLTDFSQIKRAQDSINFSCFHDDLDFEFFLIPSPLLNLASYRQQENLERLEGALSLEWGGRVSFHADGFDLAVYHGRFFDNSPRALIDINSFSLAGFYANQFNLFGVGMVYAIDRLLFEIDFSYQKELAHKAESSLSGHPFLSIKELQERGEFSFGFEYTTNNNHRLSSGLWFFDYEENIITSDFRDTFLLNVGWSKQYLNDDLTLSALGLWQEYPGFYQFTFLTEYLLNDYWALSTALSYQRVKSDGSFMGLPQITSNESKSIQFSAEYQF